VKILYKGLALVDLEERETKNGNTMRKVKLANRTTFDSIECSLEWEHSMDGIVQGRDFDVVFDVKPAKTGYDFTVRATLTPVADPVVSAALGGFPDTQTAKTPAKPDPKQ
jgi:hypothetical protein